MNKYDVACRLKRMVSENYKISLLENKIARKSAKYYQQLNELKTCLKKQEYELAACRDKVKRLKHTYNKLQLILQEKEKSLCGVLLNVKQMEVQYHQQLKNQIEERVATATTVDCVCKLKQATQTYINLAALPHAIQGVTLCEKETSTDWRPFCIDPLKHTRKEVQDEIWQNTQLDSVYRHAWEKLLFGNRLEEHNENMEFESADDRVI